MLLSVSLLTLVSGCSSKSTPKAGIFELDNNTFLVKGRAERIEEEYLIVQYSRTKNLRLETSEDMILKGFPSLWAIEADEPIKVNYKIEGNEKIIINISKMPELGC